MRRSVQLKLLLTLLGAGLLAASCATTKRAPASSVVLRSKMDKKIVALKVELRDNKLGQVALGIAEGDLENDAEIVAAMAENQSPYVQWEVFQSEGGDLDAYIAGLRRLSPARCGLVDKPQETAICARAVIELNRVPTSASEGEELRLQGAAQGSARVEQVLVMTPTGEIVPATLNRDERAFEATFTPAAGAGLYTVEIVARTGRGLEPAARWWLEVGSGDLPEVRKHAPDAEDAKPADLAKRAFQRLNQDRQGKGQKPIAWSTALAKMAEERATSFAKQGALSPPDQEKLAKIRVEGDRAVSRYSEALGDEYAIDAIQDEIMESPSKRRVHLDSAVTIGATAVARGREKPPRLYLVEVMGRSYDPTKPTELRDAIVDRVNLARSRKAIAPTQVNRALQSYAQSIADRNLKRNDFLEKDDMGRTVSDAILGDIDGLQFAGSEMFRVSGAEEVTPGATPTNKRFTQIGVGVARKAADMWWVVILVAAPE